MEANRVKADRVTNNMQKNAQNPYKTKGRFRFGLMITFVIILSVWAVVACTDNAKARFSPIVKEAPRPGVAAKVNAKEISLDALIGDRKAEIFDLEKRKYDLLKEQLQNFVVNDTIEEEAKKAGMTPEVFTQKKIFGGEVKVSDSEYKKFVAERHIPDSQINEQIKGRINAYIKDNKEREMKAAFAFKKSGPVEFYISKPKMDVNIDVGNAPVWGKPDAPVTIVEHSDFECPFCKGGAETINLVKKKYGNKVRIAFKHFPLPMHQNARPAAEASMCVNEQGSDKFWKFHDLAFKNQDKLDKANLEKFAKESGADPKKFNECVAAKKYADYIQKDMAYGEKIGVRSTPTFFINNQMVSGAVPIDQISETIDEELAAKKQ